MYSFYMPHERVPALTGGPLVTKQSMAAECDINNILKQFSKTGIINHVNKSAAQWLDLPSEMDFQQSISIVQEASDAFASLPSKVREYFSNSPLNLLSALSDASQRDKLVEFGILKPVPNGGPAGAQGDGATSTVSGAQPAAAGV